MFLIIRICVLFILVILSTLSHLHGPPQLGQMQLGPPQLGPPWHLLGPPQHFYIKSSAHLSNFDIQILAHLSIVQITLVYLSLVHLSFLWLCILLKLNPPQLVHSEVGPPQLEPCQLNRPTPR